MAKNDNLTDFLKDIADAIREKRGTSGPISAQNFSTEIAAIEGGGASTPDMPVIGDGKTYLYIKIAAEGRMTVPLYFSQTVSNGVAIDWGDGSATQTLSGAGNKNTTHTYAEIGEYRISLNPASGCTLGLGYGALSYCVMGSTGASGRVYCNMLQAVEVGRNVTSIGNYAFNYCYGMAFYDFSQCTSVPTLGGKSVFSSIPSDCKIVVPDSLYDTWKAATNWSTHASNMVKASGFNI